MYTRHTVLLRKGYNSSEATFVAGHPTVVDITRGFNSKEFSAYAAGTYFVGVFQVSSRRKLMHHYALVGNEYFRALSSERDNQTTKYFFATNFTSLVSQSRGFRNNHFDFDGTDFKGSAFAAKFNVKDNNFTERNDGTTLDGSWAKAYSEEVKAKIDAVLGSKAAAVETEMVEPVEEPKLARKVMALSDLNAYVELESVFVKRGDLELLNAMKAIAASNTASNVLMIGPSGAGKTSIPEAFAKANGMKYIYMNCAVVRDPEEWFGYREAVDGSTAFVPTAFSNAVMEGNAVIVMDEINRVEPWLHNTLYPLLDHRRSTNVHGTEIKVGEGVIFVATANLGGRFTGTFLLDAALSNRFDAILSVRYLPAEVESQILTQRIGVELDTAKKIIAVVEKLRSIEQEREAGIDVSTRTALRLANIYAHSQLPFISIVEAAAIAAVDDVVLRKQIIDEVNVVVSTTGL